jgi:hypothetical protein
VSETPERNPVEQALDLFLYAPIGLLCDGASLLPKLVERGRTQVTMARMVGEYAVNSQVLSRFTSPSPAAPSPSSTPEPSPAPAPVATSGEAPRVDAKRSSTSAAAAQLAIPDYDGLSASQVVNRLAGLSVDELEAVRSYEAAHRGRKTILSKVAQLQSA